MILPNDKQYVTIRHVYMGKEQETEALFINGQFIFDFYSGTGACHPEDVISWEPRDSTPKDGLPNCSISNCTYLRPITKAHVFPASVTVDHEWIDWIAEATELLAFANEISDLLSGKKSYPALCGPARNGRVDPITFVNWPHRYHDTFVIDPKNNETDESVLNERKLNSPHNYSVKVVQPYGISINAKWIDYLLSSSLWKKLPCLHDILTNGWHADLVNFRAFFGKAMADFGNAIYVIIPVHTDLAVTDDPNTGKKRVFSLVVSYDMYYPLKRAYLVHGTPDEILNCEGYRHWTQSWDFEGKIYRDSIIEITPDVIGKIHSDSTFRLTKPEWHPFDIISSHSVLRMVLGVAPAGTTVGPGENISGQFTYQRVEPTLAANVE